MSRNIKEIGKELMGKSLNSFHRKTGLTQLEKNNEMQDGILDGILSQVDDAYIEKTEQSNVIHLDGSGDGVVVLDSVEGNTMVNRMPKFNGIYTTTSEVIVPSFEAKYSRFGNIHCLDVTNMPRNITIISLGKGIGVEWLSDNENGNGVSWKGVISTNQTIKHTILDNRCTSLSFKLPLSNGYTSNDVKNIQILILEGDWTNREIPQYFEGLQSSFEEKVNDEGKYEIEILSKNKNLYTYGDLKNWSYNNGTNKAILECVRVQPNTTYTLSKKGEGLLHAIEYSTPKHDYIGNPKYNHNSVYTNRDGIEYKVNNATGYVTFTTGKNINYLWITGSNGATGEEVVNQTEIQLEKGNSKTNYIPHKSNKIKLLINEPLRGVGNTKDRLCIKNNKLLVERNCGELIINGTEPWIRYMQKLEGVWEYYIPKTPHFYYKVKQNSLTITDKVLSYKDNTTPLNKRSFPCVVSGNEHWRLFIQSTLTNVDELKQWLQTNPITVTYELAEPYYEEVLNEHGEPIILEGYENGTIYIDSTIVPTTTVRYTPKMESFKTLKEVENNNIMLTNDVNDNIIPYMMDVDLMIMEKEMALMSHKNIRTIGVKDMTSMQKRTQDMLTRLIKGKTLTEQECKTRVVTYLDAGKITDAQADELMLLISEVYA